MRLRFGLGAAAAVVVIAFAAAVTRSCGSDGSPRATPAVAPTPSQPRETAPTEAPQAKRSRARPVSEEADSATEAETDEWVATLMRQGAMVVGVVQTPDGTPVPDAFVALGDVDDAYDTAITGTDGRFALDDIPSYSSVCAVAIRGGDVWEGSVPADGFPLDLTVTVERRPSRGIVFVRVLGHDGATIPRARAQAVAGERRETSFFGGEVSIAGGYFLVVARRWRSGASPLFLVDSAADDEGRALPYGPALVEVDPLGASSVEVRLPPGVALSGRVETPDGAPASEVAVVLDPPVPEGFDADHMDRPRWITAWSDGEGRFAFGALGVGIATLRVPHRDGVHGGSIPVSVATGAREVVIRLRRTRDLRVVVHDELGSPVGAAKVYLTVDHEEIRRELRTGADGSCDVPDLPEHATALLAVEATGFVPHRRRLEVTEPDRRVVLVREATISGRVIGPDGLALDEVSILVDPRGQSRVVWRGGSTFEVLGLTAGADVTLFVVDDSRTLAPTRAFAGGAPVTLRWPNEPDRLTLLLPKARSPVTRVVVCDGGRVLASVDATGALVSVPSGDFPDSVSVQVGPTWDGRFAFRRDLAARGFHRIEFERGATVSGRVIVADGGDPGFLEGAATADCGLRVEFETTETGGFSVRGLPPGKVTLTLTTPEGQHEDTPVVAPSDDVVVRLAGR